MLCARHLFTPCDGPRASHEARAYMHTRGGMAAAAAAAVYTVQHTKKKNALLPWDNFQSKSLPKPGQHHTTKGGFGTTSSRYFRRVAARSLGIRTLPVIEKISFENRPRGCATWRVFTVFLSDATVWRMG